MPQDFVSIAEESQNISTVQPACRVRGCKGDPDFVLAYSCRTGFLICSAGIKVNFARTKTVNLTIGAPYCVCPTNQAVGTTICHLEM